MRGRKIRGMPTHDKVDPARVPNLLAVHAERHAIHAPKTQRVVDGDLLQVTCVEGRVNEAEAYTLSVVFVEVCSENRFVKLALDGLHESWSIFGCAISVLFGVLRLPAKSEHPVVDCVDNALSTKHCCCSAYNHPSHCSSANVYCFCPDNARRAEFTGIVGDVELLALNLFPRSTLLRVVDAVL